jgi:uncharacterized damage-inducible protein DinB
MSVSSLKTQFDFQTRLFNNVISGVSDDESQVRNSEHINHIKWIAGHMLNTRLGTMSKMAGLQPDESYGTQFGRGSVLDMNATYPSLEEITAKWQAVSPAISEGLSNIPAEVLASKAPFQTPITNIDDSIHGVLLFLLSHEGYHIGQLSILRKMAGKEAMSFS